MTDDIYLLAIVLLLPITASMVIFQTNPYHALVIRGILGALAALVYALFGAADVALTEALVGTMLSITLYAIAVRSSMRMKLGILASEEEDNPVEADLLKALKGILQPHHVSLETISFTNLDDLKAALENKDLHGILVPQQSQTYHFYLRLKRLAEIFQPKLPEAIADLTVIASTSSTPNSINLTPNVDS